MLAISHGLTVPPRESSVPVVLRRDVRPLTSRREEGERHESDSPATPEPRASHRFRTTRLPKACFNGAAAAALALALGTVQGSVTMTSGAPFANIKRSYTSLSQAAREGVDSRVKDPLPQRR